MCLQICSYTNKQTGEVLTIQEAIDRGFILADSARIPAPETRSWTIRSVIDPRTGEEIPIADAVRHRIVNKNKGEYLNLQTEEVMPIAEAIRRGLVITEPIDQAGKTTAIVGIGKTRVYMIKSVQDQNTGKYILSLLLYLLD